MHLTHRLAAARFAPCLALAALTGCSGGFSAAPASFDVGVSPSPFGFDVNVLDDETGELEYVIPGHTFSFASNAGAVGATVEGYDITFFDASGNPAFPGDSVQRSSGSLNVYVPPGVVCEGEGEEDAAPPSSAQGACTINSPDAALARGRVSTSQTVYVMPLDIAAQLYELVGVGGAVGAYAHVHFYGTDDVQRPFRTETPYRFAVQIPLGD